MGYTAPEIKDRVADGDDLYSITTSNGKSKLTPSPNSVSEVGTPINKALLQPLCNAVEEHSIAISPYDLYWWKRQPTASSYSETQTSAVGNTVHKRASASDGLTHYFLAFEVSCYDGNSEYTYYYAGSLQYASSITIDQSTGAVSLKNPTAVTVNESTLFDSTFFSQFEGKYVKGFESDSSKIFYVPANAPHSSSASWTSSDGSWVRYYGYEFTSETNKSLVPKIIGSVKNTETGEWESVSSDDSTTYPHSGTSDGYNWMYFGKIYDAVLLPDASRSAEWQSVTLTSANFSDNAATVEIPYKKVLVVIATSTTNAGGCFGVFDSEVPNFCGVAYQNTSSLSSKIVATLLYLYLYSSYDLTVKFQSEGLKITHSGSYSGTIYVKYLPLDSLER